MNLGRSSGTRSARTSPARWLRRASSASAAWNSAATSAVSESAIRAAARVLCSRAARVKRRFDQRGEAVQRVVVLERPCLGGREVLGEALLERGPGEHPLVREPAVERRDADAGVAGDLLERGIGSLLRPYDTFRAARWIRSALRAASARSCREASVVTDPV